MSQAVNGAVRLDRRDQEVRLDEVERYWHQVAPWYDGDLAGRDNAGHTRSPAELRAWKLTFRRILGPPPLRVLDVGTGTGNLALLLASFGYDVTAVDIAAGMLDITRAKAERAGLDITLAQAKAADLHFESATFGAVVSRLVLWSQPEPEHTVRSWRRVTRPGGRVVTIETLHGRRGGLTARARHGLGQAALRLQGKPTGFLDDRARLDQLPLGNVDHPSAYRNTFLRAGLRDILIEPLIGIHRIQRRSLPLPHRLWPSDLEYLVEGTVPDGSAVR